MDVKALIKAILTTLGLIGVAVLILWFGSSNPALIKNIVVGIFLAGAFSGLVYLWYLLYKDNKPEPKPDGHHCTRCKPPYG